MKHYRSRTLMATTLAVGVVSLSTTACVVGDTPEPPATVPCAVVADATASDTFLTDKISSVISGFLRSTDCDTVAVRTISSNSVGESCTASDVAMDLQAAVDNTDARATEVSLQIVPQVTARVRSLTNCVRAAGRDRGTDVVGAFTSIAELSGRDAAPHVLMISDLVQNIGVDVQRSSLADAEVASATTDALAQALPAMGSWHITLSGLGAGTSYLTPAHSAALHQVWQDALRRQGAVVKQAGV